MREIETELLYYQDGTKQFTTQRDTSLCVTFVGMFLLRKALDKYFNDNIQESTKLREINDILYRKGMNTFEILM